MPNTEVFTTIQATIPPELICSVSMNSEIPKNINRTCISLGLHHSTFYDEYNLPTASVASSKILRSCESSERQQATPWFIEFFPSFSLVTLLVDLRDLTCGLRACSPAIQNCSRIICQPLKRLISCPLVSKIF